MQNQTFMKEKPVLPLIISMALPMVISMLVNSLYNIMDSYFVAKISEDAMTALSLVYPIQNLIGAMAIGFGIGINAAISISLGAGNNRSADKAASQGVLLSLVHGIILSIVSIAVMPRFLGIFQAEGEVLKNGLRYSNMVFLFAAAIQVGIAYEKIFQAVGRMKVSMFSMLCGCVANIILDPIMIFGLGPFPAMGIEGAALATGLSQTLTMVIYMVIYAREPIGVRVTIRCMRPEGRMAGRLYAVGIPAALNLALSSVLITVLNGILAEFSQAYVLILGIYYKLQTFIYLTANGIIQGMRPVIGYNYGAEESRRVQKIFQTTMVMCAVVMTVGLILCQVIPGRLIGLFSTNAVTIAQGAAALRIISLGFVISAISVTACGSLEGIGKGLPSLLISVMRYVAVIIPAAYIGSRTFGAKGVWMAFPITEVIAAVVSCMLYRRFFQDRGKLV